MVSGDDLPGFKGVEGCGGAGGGRGCRPTEGVKDERFVLRIPKLGMPRTLFQPLVFQKPVPNKEPCPLTPGKSSILSSQEPSSSAIPSVSWTSEHKAPQQAWPSLSFALFLVLVLLVTSAIILLALQRHHRRLNQGKAVQHLYPSLVCSDLDTHTRFLHSSSPASLETSEARDIWKEVSLSPLLGRG